MHTNYIKTANQVYLVAIVTIDYFSLTLGDVVIVTVYNLTLYLTSKVVVINTFLFLVFLSLLTVQPWIPLVVIIEEFLSQ